VSLAVFGSVGRRSARPDSDIDLLIVAESLPDGRIQRVEEFGRVETKVAGKLRDAEREGLMTRLSPIFKTRQEVEHGSPLFFDMLDDARILYDAGGFLQGAFDSLRARLERLGARRVWRGNAWFWDLKPDYKVGEVFEL
jgi:hypothetical protein